MKGGIFLLYEKLLSGEEKLSVIGLGYVGLPIAVAFAEKVKVIGFDVNRAKIEKYQSGCDPTGEVGNRRIKTAAVDFTSDEKRLHEAKFHIVAVPTPVKDDNTPDLSALISASETLGRNLSRGSVVVYESTVYPGVTEEICVPALERTSGLVCGSDFKVGYSPERINPGDKDHRLENIVKIVSGMDEDTLDTVADVYSLVAKAGVYKAGSVRIAEAAKVIENSQRDINIAFMNELSIIFDKMGIDTLEVLKAAGTKWNFLGFTPGLVGGHCIGVDPYYLTYKAGQLGYHSRIILAGRMINDDMGRMIGERLVCDLFRSGISAAQARVAILGFTFKENCPDTRNTKVLDIVRTLRKNRVDPLIFDPVADADEAKREYGIELCGYDHIREVDAVVIAVAHYSFRKTLTEKVISGFYRADSRKRILYDLKGMIDKEELPEEKYLRYSL